MFISTFVYVHTHSPSTEGRAVRDHVDSQWTVLTQDLNHSSQAMHACVNTQKKAQEKKNTLKLLIQVQYDYNTGTSLMQIQPLSLRISLPLCHLVMNADFKKLTSEIMEWQKRNHNDKHKETGNTQIPEELLPQVDEHLTVLFTVCSIERKLNQKAKPSIHRIAYVLTRCYGHELTRIR